MTLREIFTGLKKLISDFFNKLLDYDLTNVLIFLILIVYFWFIYYLFSSFYKFFKKNFHTWSVLKKVGHITGYAFMFFWLVILPLGLYLIG